jgi:hypothetical protein
MRRVRPWLLLDSGGARDKRDLNPWYVGKSKLTTYDAADLLSKLLLPSLNK